MSAWDGSAFSPLGDGIQGGYGLDDEEPGDVLDLEVFDDALWAVGDFAFAGGAAVTNCLAKWNGSSWSNPVSGLPSEFEARVIGVHSGTLYIGGDSNTTSSCTSPETPAGGTVVYAWSGTAWTAVGERLFGGLDVAHNGDLVSVGGALHALYPSYRNDCTPIYALNGATRLASNSWGTVGPNTPPGPRFPVLAALDFDGHSYFGGGVTVDGGTPYGALRRLNGSGWSEHPDLDAGSGNAVSSLLVGDPCFSEASMFVGGPVEPDSAGSPQSVWRVPSASSNFVPVTDRTVTGGVQDMEVYGGHLFVVADSISVGLYPKNYFGIARVRCCLCPADHDCSGYVDPDDLSDFIADYELGDAAADFDDSGTLDPDDLSDYIAAYVEGCD